MSTPADQLDLSNFPQPQLQGLGAPVPQIAQLSPQGPPPTPAGPSFMYSPNIPQNPQYQQLMGREAQAETQSLGLSAPTGLTTTPIDQERAALNRSIDRIDPTGATAGAAQTALGLPSDYQAQSQASLQRSQDIYNRTKQQSDIALAALQDIQKRLGPDSDEYKQAVAIYAEREKRLGELNADMSNLDKKLFEIQKGHAAEQQTLDQKLTEWATQTPTRQATYAVAMHLAAPLSILAAIGGAATKTNAIGLLQATNGIVEGINSGSETRYRAALDEWKTRYEALNDHLTRVNDTFKTMKDAYTGMADADERAAARTRLMTQDQLESSQLRLGNQVKLLDAADKYGAVLANQAKAVAAMDAAWARSLLPYGVFGGWQGTTAFDPATTKLKDMDPVQLHAFLGSRGLSLPSVARAPLASESGAISIYGDMTADDYARQVLAGKAGVVETTTEARTVAGGSARVIEAVTELNRPGGNFDQILDAARKVDFSNNRWSIQARRWYRDNVRADPDIQNLITAITETYGPLSIMLAGVGGSSRGATDTTRHWAETELPAYGSYDEMASAINRSRIIADNARAAGGEVQRLIREGKTMDEIYKAAVTDPRAVAAGATTPQQQAAPPQAIEYLRQHPEFREQFRQKYGYLPQ